MKAKENSDADKRVAKRMDAEEDAGDDHRAAEEKASEGKWAAVPPLLLSYYSTIPPYLVLRYYPSFPYFTSLSLIHGAVLPLLPCR